MQSLLEAVKFVSKTYPFAKDIDEFLVNLDKEFDVNTESTIPDYYKRLHGFVFSKDPRLANDIRSLFLPTLSSIDQSDPQAALALQQNEEKPRKGRKRKSDIAAAAAAANDPTRIFVSSKCLVKRLPDGSTVYSSLPKDLTDTSELELVDEVTEMEILPTSYADIDASTSRMLIKDISPAVQKPTHVNKVPPMYKKRNSSAKVVTFLDFGPFSSFAPTFDSTDAEVAHDVALEHYVSLLANAQYEKADEVAETVMIEAATQGQKDKQQGTQTLLSDVVDQKQIDEWLNSATEKSTEDDQMVVDESDAVLGPVEVAEYLKQNGIDIDEIIDETRKPPSAEELETILQSINKELILLYDLQQDRLQQTHLTPAAYARLCSLIAPKDLDALNPLEDNQPIKLNPADSQHQKAILQLFEATPVEKKIYSSVVEKLIKLVPHVPSRDLIKKFAIRKLMLGGWSVEDHHVHRGSLIKPPPPVHHHHQPHQAPVVLNQPQTPQSQQQMSQTQQLYNQQLMNQYYAQQMRASNQALVGMAGQPPRPNYPQMSPMQLQQLQQQLQRNAQLSRYQMPPMGAMNPQMRPRMN